MYLTQWVALRVQTRHVYIHYDHYIYTQIVKHCSTGSVFCCNLSFKSNSEIEGTGFYPAHRTVALYFHHHLSPATDTNCWQKNIRVKSLTASSASQNDLLSFYTFPKTVASHNWLPTNSWMRTLVSRSDLIIFCWAIVETPWQLANQRLCQCQDCLRGNGISSGNVTASSEDCECAASLAQDALSTLRTREPAAPCICGTGPKDSSVCILHH